jgi:hypothetical protein
MNVNMAAAQDVLLSGDGVGLAVVVMFVAACLLAALFLVWPMAGFRASWREVCDTLCVLALLAMGMVVVFVFSV